MKYSGVSRLLSKNNIVRSVVLFALVLLTALFTTERFPLSAQEPEPIRTTSITLTSPNGGEQLSAGSGHTIQWRHTGTIDTVTIEFSVNSGSSWAAVATGIDNHNQYLWAVPTNISTNCLIRVSQPGTGVEDVSDAVFAITSGSSQCGETWTVSSDAGSATYNAVTYGDAKFIAVGSGGTIKTGSDGVTWVSQTSGSTDFLRSVAYGNNRFVVVGSSGVILTSPHGHTWTARDSGVSTHLVGVAYGAEGFVAVGVNGVIVTGTDGISWQQRSSGTTNALYRVVYAKGRYAAVGANGIVLRSTDGISWQSAFFDNNVVHWGLVLYNDNKYIAVGNNGTISSSLDAATWNSGSMGESVSLKGVAIDNDSLFAVVGAGGVIYVGTSVGTLESRSSGVSTNLFDVCFHHSRYVAVGDQAISTGLCGGEIPFITVVSPNGGEVEISGTVQPVNWTGSASIGFVKIEYSTDSGSTWTAITSATENTGSYDWTIPALQSTNCLVRVSDTEGETSDTGDAEFTITPPVITVTSPKTGKYYGIGSSIAITWQSVGVDEINLAIRKADDSAGEAIALVPATPSSYSYAVPSELESGQYFIRATDGVTTGESGLFRVDQVVPQITGTVPADGAYVNATPITLSGSVVEEYIDTVTINNTPADLDGSGFSLANVDLLEGDNAFAIAATDLAGNSSTANITVKLDSTAPVITITSPADGAVVNTSTITVTGTVTENDALDYVKVNNIVATVDGTNYTCEVPGLIEGDNTITVEARDEAGNITTDNITVTLDTSAPVITITDPADGAVVNTSTITITGTVTENDALDYVKVNNIVATVDGSNYTCEVPGLVEGANTITVEARDEAGNISNESITVTVDTTPPAITITNPADGAVVNTATIEVTGTISDGSSIVYLKVGTDEITPHGA